MSNISDFFKNLGCKKVSRLNRSPKVSTDLSAEVVPQQEERQENAILGHLYNNRKNFNILALTGPIGCGIDDLKEIISTDFDQWKDQVRDPKDIIVNIPEHKNDKFISEHQIIKQMVFKRKYTICHNFWSSHHVKYTILEYNKVALLYALTWIAKDCTSGKDFQENIRDNLSKIIAQTNHGKKYFHQKSEQETQKTITPLFSNVLNRIGNIISFKQLYDDIKKQDEILCPFNLKDEKKDTFAGYFLTKNSIFDTFYSLFCSNLKKEDYFIFHYLWHLIGSNIRKHGSPIKPNNDSSNNGDTLFYLIELLNIIIKRSDKTASRLYCINKLSNSLEIRYLKERYNAFYPIAIHKTNNLLSAIQEEVDRIVPSNNQNKGHIIKHTFNLGTTEIKIDDYKKGECASPDIEQCVSQAEIHIRIKPFNQTNNSKSEFYSTAEQWMKFASLIFHPGLITPSSDERCMEVAYTAKLNSSCVSRQVGAVITNAAHSIRSIGWNEVPYGQMPCGLRSLSDIVNKDFKDYKQYMYSDFEKCDSNKTDIYKDGKTFQQKVNEDYEGIINEMNKRSHSQCSVFCFRELHNRYTSGNNQVYGRSLHAEENALIQMSKFGGEGLMNGLIYVTASPCELCSRKLYQVGVRKIVYIDPYPGIAREQTIASGYLQPKLMQFRGAYGASYYKLYTPLIAPKDEQSLRCKDLKCELTEKADVLKKVQTLLNKVNCNIDISKSTFTSEEVKQIEEQLTRIINNPNKTIEFKVVLQILTLVLK